MRRIGLAVVLALSLLAAPLAAQAQQAGKVWRIGFLYGPTSDDSIVAAFRLGLREHGYVEGQNLLIEWRLAEGRFDRLPSLAAELVGLKVDIIVTLSTEAALAAKKATASIPIVFTQVSDPVAPGVVPSLARPGGKITEFSIEALRGPTRMARQGTQGPPMKRSFLGRAGIAGAARIVIIGRGGG
jgi:putative tryptophan/tyrosine transport system substrate-binding protein